MSCESPNINEAAIRNVSHIFRKAGKTKSGRPCRNRVPCSRHSLKTVGERKLGKLDAAQRDNLVKGVLADKDVRSAALDAGYSEATAQGRIYQIIKTPDMRERFQRIANDAAVNTNEIIGTLVQQMRFDIADMFLKVTSYNEPSNSESRT